MSEGIRNITNELNENFIIVEQLAKYEKSIINYGNLLMINEQSYSIQEIKNFYPLLDQAYVQSCKIESLALFFFDLIEAGSQNIENNELLLKKKQKLMKISSLEAEYKMKENIIIQEIKFKTQELNLLNSFTLTMQEIIENIQILEKNTEELLLAYHESCVSETKDTNKLIKSLNFSIKSVKLPEVNFTQDYSEEVDKTCKNALIALKKSLEIIINSTQKTKIFTVNPKTEEKFEIFEALFNTFIDINFQTTIKIHKNYYTKIFIGINSLIQNTKKLHSAFSSLFITTKKGIIYERISFQKLENSTVYVAPLGQSRRYIASSYDFSLRVEPRLTTHLVNKYKTIFNQGITESCLNKIEIELNSITSQMNNTKTCEVTNLEEEIKNFNKKIFSLQAKTIKKLKIQEELNFLSKKTLNLPNPE